MVRVGGPNKKNVGNKTNKKIVRAPVTSSCGKGNAQAAFWGRRLFSTVAVILRLFSAYSPLDSCRAWRAAEPRRRRAKASEVEARYRGERSSQLVHSCLVCTRDAGL